MTRAGVGLPVVCAVAGAMAAGLWWLWQDAPECVTRIGSVFPAPDGGRQAVVFGRECDATVPLNTQVSVLGPGQVFSPEGTPPVLVVDGEHALTVLWQPDGGVEITLPDGVRLYRQEAEAAGIPVRYR